MKNKYFILTFIVLIAGSVLTGCNSNREKRVEDAKENVKQANQDLKDAQTDSISDWQQFKNDAEIKISANEQRIAEFKVKIKTTSKEFKAKYDREITVLEQKNVELKKKINEYKYEGKDKWEEFKQGFNHDMDVVEKALKDIFAKKD
jgi:predicted  nucleic acid-binding Zn-ribbon protein